MNVLATLMTPPPSGDTAADAACAEAGAPGEVAALVAALVAAAGGEAPAADSAETDLLAAVAGISGSATSEEGDEPASATCGSTTSVTPIAGPLPAAAVLAAAAALGGPKGEAVVVVDAHPAPTLISGPTAAAAGAADGETAPVPTTVATSAATEPTAATDQAASAADFESAVEVSPVARRSVASQPLPTPAAHSEPVSAQAAGANTLRSIADVPPQGAGGEDSTVVSEAGAAMPAPSTQSAPSPAVAPPGFGPGVAAVAAATPPAPPLPGVGEVGGAAPVDVPDLDPNVARLGGLVRSMRGGEVRSATLTLRPAELGEVHVELRANNGSVSVHLTASHTDGADALRAATPALRRDLEQAGLGLDRVDVGVGGGQGGEAGDARRHSLDDADGPAESPARSPVGGSVGLRRPPSPVRTRAADGIDLDL